MLAASDLFGLPAPPADRTTDVWGATRWIEEAVSRAGTEEGETESYEYLQLGLYGVM